MAPTAMLSILALLLPLAAADTDLCYTETCSSDATACSSSTCQTAITALRAGCQLDRCSEGLTNATALLGPNDMNPFTRFTSCYVTCVSAQPDPCNVTCATTIAACAAIPACTTAYAQVSDNCDANCINANRPAAQAAAAAFDSVLACYLSCDTPDDDDDGDDDDDDDAIVDSCNRVCGEPQFLCQSDNTCLQAVQQVARRDDCDAICLQSYRPLLNSSALLYDNYFECLYSCIVNKQRDEDDECPFASLFELNPCQFQGCADENPPLVSYPCCQYSQLYCQATNCSGIAEATTVVELCSARFQLLPDRSGCADCTTLRGTCQESTNCAAALVRLDEWMSTSGSLAECNATCVSAVTGGQPGLLPTLRKIIGCAQTCGGECPLQTISQPDLSPCNSPACDTFPSVTCCQHLTTYCLAYPTDCSDDTLEACASLSLLDAGVALECAAVASECISNDLCSAAWANTTQFVSEVFFGDWVAAACGAVLDPSEECLMGLEPTASYQSAALYTATLRCYLNRSLANGPNPTRDPLQPIRLAYITFESDTPDTVDIFSTSGSVAAMGASVAGRTSEQLGMTQDFLGMMGPDAWNGVRFPVVVPQHESMLVFMDFVLAAGGLSEGDTALLTVIAEEGDSLVVLNLTANSTGHWVFGDEFYSVEVASSATYLSANLPSLASFELEFRVQLAASTSWVAVDEMSVSAIGAPSGPSGIGNCTFDTIQALSPCSADACAFGYANNLPVEAACCWVGWYEAVGTETERLRD
jgi:hypothetical protein